VENLRAVIRVEALRDVARELDVLLLIRAHGHHVGVEHEDVGRHEHRVTEQAHVDVGVLVLLHLQVARHEVLVGVRAVHEPLGREAG
jgi:hypothetical protein